MSRSTKIQAGFALCSLLLLAAAARGHVGQDWVRQYDGSNHYNDYAGPMVVDHAGNVIVAGQSLGGFWTIKYNSDGILSSTWPDIGCGIGVRRYEHETEHGTEYGIDVAVDEAYNVYVVGVSTHPGGSPGSFDFLTLKYDATGQGIWRQRYDDPAGQEDTPVAIALDDSANVFVAGTAPPGRMPAANPKG